MKSIKNIVLSTFLGILPFISISTDVQARNPWLHCGIGALIFENTGWAAASSNIIWDLGTTATTSNSSSPGTCNGRGGRTAMYINATYANLEEETVKGEGQHLHAMLDILGCDVASHKNIISDVRSAFTKVLQDPGYSEMNLQAKSKAYYGVVMTKVDTDYSRQCQVI